MDFVGPMVDKVCSESHRGAGDENAMKQARRNHYQILEVPHAASPDEIKKAFREKAKRFHPDRQSGGEAEEEFKKLNEAYDCLGDSDKRLEYDRGLRLRKRGRAKRDGAVGKGSAEPSPDGSLATARSS